MPAPAEQLQAVLIGFDVVNRLSGHLCSRRRRGCPSLKLAPCPAWPVDASHYAIWHSWASIVAGCPLSRADGVKARVYCT